jgi:WD40-like Beta Propeller Repeat
MNADGAGKRRITATRFYETNPTFSPDGTRIAFTSDRDNRRLSKDRLGRGFDLYTMARSMAAGSSGWPPTADRTCSRTGSHCPEQVAPRCGGIASARIAAADVSAKVSVRDTRPPWRNEAPAP